MISTLSLFLFLQTNLLLLLLQVESICLDNGNYTRSSDYSNNLNTVLSSLSQNIYISGFYNASVGSRNPDIANAIALCRGDLQLHECRDCIRGITDTLLTACPDQKQAIDWTDRCMLRYSNETMLGILETWLGIWMWSPVNATGPSSLMDELRRHLDTLRGQAASGGSVRKVAAGNATGNDFQVIYAMVQCTPDLSPDECNGCLFQAYQDMRRICCVVRVGARVNMPSCNLRYEFYPFYNETRLRELDALTVPDSPAGTNNGNSTTRNIIIVVVVVSVAACVILTISVCILLRKRMKRKPEEIHEIFEATDEMSADESLKYDLTTIRDATNDFSDDNKLGRGGFGAVYRGKLSNGKEIAVKRLSLDSGQGGIEFKNEVLLLAKLQHRNLVQLLGFCLEGTEKLLMYEFVQNASLDHFIFDPAKRSLLDWEKCYKIISGIARGILYLHEDSKLRIIHRDLKPSNVLLDGAMNPKIADFGMARLFGEDETQGSTTKIAGTFGYMRTKSCERLPSRRPGAGSL